MSKVKTLPVTKRETATKTNTVSLSPETLRAMTILSSSILFAAPAFATQANPQNIVALADLFMGFVNGSISVSQPENVESPKFG